MTHDDYLEVKRSDIHGRGLFARRSISAGERLGTFPILILSPDDSNTVRSTLLYHYVFHVDETEDQGQRLAVAFGMISMCNHNPEANTVFSIDADAEELILESAKAIAVGEEIFIDYGDFAGEAVGDV